MSRYRLFPAARQDIRDICRYIAADNPPAAVRFREGLRARFRLLASQPFMGEARDDLAPGLRMLTAGNYVILYRPMAGGVEIVQVVHGARDIGALWGKPPGSP
jgi:toxin ParE1/3/4